MTTDHLPPQSEPRRVLLDYPTAWPGTAALEH